MPRLQREQSGAGRASTAEEPGADETDTRGQEASVFPFRPCALSVHRDTEQQLMSLENISSATLDYSVRLFFFCLLSTMDSGPKRQQGGTFYRMVSRNSTDCDFTTCFFVASSVRNRRLTTDRRPRYVLRLPVTLL